ncbi:MAG: transglycosylase SLT domain-containing protein [Cetobacterium sp.]
MKILKIVIILLMLEFKSFSYNVDDYIFLNKAIEANEKKDYKKSLFFYEIYEKNFINSYPMTSNYAKFYIAKNYMEMNKDEEALLWFSRAIYIPDNYLKQKVKKSNFFQYRKDFFMGKIYLKNGNIDSGKDSLKRLILDYYDPEAQYYEKIALQLLSNYDKKYSYIYDVKYNENKKFMNKIDEKEQKKIISFFYDKKKYEKVIQLLDIINDYKNMELNFKLIYLESLLRLNLNEKVIELTNDSENQIAKIYLFRGMAFEQSKKFSKAIYNYEKIKDLRVKDRALFRIARIHYKLENYKSAKDTIEKTVVKNQGIKSLMLEIYIKLKNKKKFIESYNEFKMMYPQNHKMGLYYIVYNNLMKKEKDPWELANYNVFFASNYVVRNYFYSLKEYGLEKKYKEKVLEKALKQIGEFKNSELLELAVQSTNLNLNPDTIEDKKIIIDSFIEAEFYKEAFKKASEFKKDFYSYKNLLYYIYPKYYKNEVDKALKNNLLPESLIYTVIYVESGFDKKSTQYDKIGLMGINKEEVKEKEEDFYNPQKNINKGVEKLRLIYKKHNSMILKTLVEYIYGEKTLKMLNFEINGDLKIETISDEKLQQELEEIVYTYAFYSAIYN